jgi:hypothetical protein
MSDSFKQVTGKASPNLSKNNTETSISPLHKISNIETNLVRRPSKYSYTKGLKRTNTLGSASSSLTAGSLKSSKEMEQAMGSQEVPLTETDIMSILNRFVFYLFLLFIIFLNLVCLFIFPYLIKEPMSMEEN